MLGKCCSISIVVHLRSTLEVSAVSLVDSLLSISGFFKLNEAEALGRVMAEIAGK